MSTDILEPAASASVSSPGRDWANAKIPYALITFFVLLVMWQVATVVLKIPAYLVPSPMSVLSVMIEDWRVLGFNSAVTAAEVIAGFLLSLAVGLPLATCITYSKVLDRAIYPLIIASQTIPKVALAPLLLAWFGFGMTPKITIVVLVAFFPIVINSVVGLRSAPPQMLHLAQSMGASQWQMFWHFRLPEALPSIFAGMKMAIVLCVIGAIVAEFVGAESGLGYLTLVAGANFDLDMQFAAIVLLSAMGMVFFAAIGWIERISLPWHVSVRSQNEG